MWHLVSGSSNMIILESNNNWILLEGAEWLRLVFHDFPRGIIYFLCECIKCHSFLVFVSITKTILVGIRFAGVRTFEGSSEIFLPLWIPNRSLSVELRVKYWWLIAVLHFRNEGPRSLGSWPIDNREKSSHNGEYLLNRLNAPAAAVAVCYPVAVATEFEVVSLGIKSAYSQSILFWTWAFFIVLF